MATANFSIRFKWWEKLTKKEQTKILDDKKMTSDNLTIKSIKDLYNEVKAKHLNCTGFSQKQGGFYCKTCNELAECFA